MQPITKDLLFAELGKVEYDILNHKQILEGLITYKNQLLVQIHEYKEIESDGGNTKELSGTAVE